MLVGEDLGGRHDTGLVAIIHSQQGCEQCHDGFATTYIALQEAVHLFARLEVGLNLAYHAFLRIGEREGQAVLVEGVERLAHNRHREADILFAAFHLSEDLQLDIEEFFEFEPFARLLHGRGILREMDIAERFAQAHEVVALHQIHAKRIHHTLLLELGYEVRDDGAEGFGIEPSAFHRFGGVVVRFEPLHEFRLHLTHRREFGVNEVVLMIEARRFAKQQILHVALQFDILHTLEPNEFDGMPSVGESGG